MIDNPIKCNEPVCPVEKAMSVIGGKWKLVILFHLSYGTKRYSELMKLLSNVSDRMLARTLKELEESNLIQRNAFAEVPVRVEYSLSETASDLLPIIESLYQWGTKLNELEQ
jgi:DNA-binding HxlR family transcriptional regulator